MGIFIIRFHKTIYKKSIYSTILKLFSTSSVSLKSQKNKFITSAPHDAREKTVTFRVSSTTISRVSAFSFSPVSLYTHNLNKSQIFFHVNHLLNVKPSPNKLFLSIFPFVLSQIEYTENLRKNI